MMIKDKELKKLQESLSKIALFPLNNRDRKKRDKLTRKLLESAKKVGEVGSIDLEAGQKGFF